MYDDIDNSVEMTGSAALRAIWNYWLTTAGQQFVEPDATGQLRPRSDAVPWRVPARRDFDPPLEIPRFVRNICLLDVVASGGNANRYRYRLNGEVARRAFGRTFQGCFVDEIFSGSFLDGVLDCYDRVCQSRIPALSELWRPFAEINAYWRLCLPLASDGDRVDMLMLAVDFEPVDCPDRTTFH